jgi:hypothetical protein
MGIELGRVSGPLLTENLLRQGTDLAFETNLLYLDVTNGYIGIKTDIPVRPLTVSGTTQLLNLLVDTQAEIANVIFNADTINNLTGQLVIRPLQSSPVVTVPKLNTANLTFVNNTLVNRVLNSNIEITADGIGSINFRKNVQVLGGIHATGNITLDGNIQFGNAASDTVSLAGRINSDIFPNQSNIHAFGSIDSLWANLFVTTSNTSDITAGTVISNIMNAGNINIINDTITNSVANQPIRISPSGVALFNDRSYITGSQILNQLNSSLTLLSTGIAHIKFSGSNGLVIPSGDTASRVSTPEVGTTRYNTQLGIPEIYNASDWSPLQGAGGFVSAAELDEILFVQDLIFG